MLNANEVNFSKLDGIIPVCIQDYLTMQILMVGFMNEEALLQTISTKKVTFWSRTKKRLWVKGETSGHDLSVIDLSLDCDQDSLLAWVKTNGPTCHTGETSCFKINKMAPLHILTRLMNIIDFRYHHPKNDSYSTRLFQEGTKRIAQKVGEEGVEVALAALSGHPSELANETADLFFHVFVLLKNNGLDLNDVTDILQSRMKKE